ncbi:hypothetical protein Vafri_15094 [Volvox africanus]|nr:hypothetical protein Vafri_15094 [Volvox africanus]
MYVCMYVSDFNLRFAFENRFCLFGHALPTTLDRDVRSSPPGAVRTSASSMPTQILAVRTVTAAPGAAVQERAVHYVLYSLHSSRSELVAALAALRPRATRPIAADQVGFMSIVVSERAGRERPHDIEREIAAQMAWLMASATPSLLPSTLAEQASVRREITNRTGMADQYSTDVDMEGQEMETILYKKGDGRSPKLVGSLDGLGVMLDIIAAPQQSLSETSTKRRFNHARNSSVADASIEPGQCQVKALLDLMALTATSNPGIAPAAERMGSMGAAHYSASAANAEPCVQMTSAKSTTAKAVTAEAVAILERPEDPPFTLPFVRRLPCIATLSGILGNPQRAETYVAASLGGGEVVHCEGDAPRRACSSAVDVVDGAVRKRAWAGRPQKCRRLSTAVLTDLLHFESSSMTRPEEMILLPCPTGVHTDGATWHQSNPETAPAAHQPGQHGEETLSCALLQADILRLAGGSGVDIGSGTASDGPVAVATTGDGDIGIETKTGDSFRALQRHTGVMDGAGKGPTLMTTGSPDRASRWREPLLPAQAPPQRPVVLHAGSERANVTVPTHLPRYFADENKYDGIQSNGYSLNHSSYNPVFCTSPKRCRRTRAAIALDQSEGAITTTSQEILGTSWLMASETGLIDR